jgi:hypothetical protein
MRHFQPAPRRNHTPWAILPKSNVDRLPTFEALLSAVDRVLHDEVRREEAGQLPPGSTIVMLERQKSITWIRQILEGQPTTTGILKPTMDSVTTEDREDTPLLRSCTKSIAFLNVYLNVNMGVLAIYLHICTWLIKSH